VIVASVVFLGIFSFGSFVDGGFFLLFLIFSLSESWFGLDR
jgi:hypothetical protein